jgi:hypothetical protein
MRNSGHDYCRSGPYESRFAVENVPKSSGENLGLGFWRHTTGVQHFVVAFQFAVELLDFAIEDIRAKNQLFESTAAGIGRMANYAASPSLKVLTWSWAV